MTMNISHKDWEALSAYVDGELTRRERVRLEDRLQSNPDLYSAYRKLRQTRHTLRRAPRLSAPRDFTLTPEMVGEKKTAEGFSWPSFFRTAAVLASVFLVMVLVFDFGGALISPRFANAPLLQEEKRASEPALEVMKEEAAEEMEAPQEPQPELSLEEEMAEGEEEAADAVETEEDLDASEMAAEATETPFPTPVPTPTRLGEEPAGLEPPGWPTIRIVEIILAGAVVGFGALAFLLRRGKSA
jgi:hypothetical protein